MYIHYMTGIHVHVCILSLLYRIFVHACTIHTYMYVRTSTCTYVHCIAVGTCMYVCACMHFPTYLDIPAQGTKFLPLLNDCMKEAEPEHQLPPRHPQNCGRGSTRQGTAMLVCTQPPSPHTHTQSRAVHSIWIVCGTHDGLQ